MSRWKLETNDDGDEVLIFDESHSLITWNIEGSDKCCYEILHLIVAAPKLLEACETALIFCETAAKGVVDDEYRRLVVDPLKNAIAFAKNETSPDPPSEEQELDWSTW